MRRRRAEWTSWVDKPSDSLLKANPQAASNTMSQLLADMRSFAVIPVTPGVSRNKLFQLRQKHEPFCMFAAQVHGKAETCAFTTKCECIKIVNYTDHMIWDVLLQWISDMDIRCEVLGVWHFRNCSECSHHPCGRERKGSQCTTISEHIKNVFIQTTTKSTTRSSSTDLIMWTSHMPRLKESLKNIHMGHGDGTKNHTRSV